MKGALIGALIGLIAWWVWWRLVVGGETFNARAVVSALGFLFLYSTLPLLFEHGIQWNWAVTGGAALGAMCFIAAIAWPKLATPEISVFVGRLGSSPITWFALFMSLWVYTATVSVVLLVQRNALQREMEEDIRAFRLAVERWVLPRRLTPEQITTIGNYLRQFPPHAVTFRMRRNDDEAQGLGTDLDRALLAGGWGRASSVELVDDIQPGMRVNVRYPEGARQKTDPRNPNPENILQEAFAKAVVTTSGGSAGQANVAQDLVIIEIGPRPRGVTGMPSRAWPF